MGSACFSSPTTSRSSPTWRRRSTSCMRGDPPNLITPPIACRFHPRCPVAFETCGWTAEEVAEDLGYLLQGKYYGTFGGAVNVQSEAERTIAIDGATDAARI